MMKLFTDFWSNEEGASAIEYALLAGVVSIGIVATLREVSTLLNAMFGEVRGGLD